MKLILSVLGIIFSISLVFGSNVEQGYEFLNYLPLIFGLLIILNLFMKKDNNFFNWGISLFSVSVIIFYILALGLGVSEMIINLIVFVAIIGGILMIVSLFRKNQ